MATAYAVARFDESQVAERKAFDRWINAALQAFVDNPEANLGDVLDQLESQGCPSTLTDDMMCLLPEACVRTLMPNLNYSPCLWSLKADGDVEYSRIMTHPIMGRGGFLASQFVDAGHGDALVPLASHGSTIQSMNKMAENGQADQFANASFAPIIVFEAGTPPDLIQKAIEASAKSVEPPPRPLWKRLFGKK